MPAPPRPPAAVLFDLDGTLADTAPEFERVINRMCSARGMPPVGASFRTTVSGGARSMVLDTFGSEPPADQYDALRAEFLDLYEQTLGEQTELFPGMTALLAALRAAAIPWGVVTNKPARFTGPLLERLGIAADCASVVCPEQVQATKPDPEGLLLACREIGCDPARTVYVGDHGRDIEAGRNAGMYTVAVRYGYIPLGERAEDWRADAIVDGVPEMHELLIGGNGADV